MARLLILFLAAGMIVSCRSTKKIQTAISKKDSVDVTESGRNDTLRLIHAALDQMKTNHISYQTFSAKVKVDYKGGDGKNYDVNANIRMTKDSAIWISANAILGIEALRVYITRDSIKLLNKLNKTYTARSVDYLKEVTSLPLDLETLQDLIIGNAVFVDSNIVSYSSGNNVISLLSLGEWFKNLLTLDESDKKLLHSKLDDRDVARNRTADLTYGDYENKKGVPFSTERRITIAEKNRLDIKLEFKQYDFNQEVSFPFSIPKNYEQN
jgi:outer membrane lipoprotein-sorting protein